MPVIINLFIIGGSVSFILWYVIFYPNKKIKGGADGAVSNN
jgi:hypothetical protein